MNTAPSMLMTAHDFVSQNPANVRHSRGLLESVEDFENNTRARYEKEGFVVNDSCYPVLVMENEDGPFAWVDCERREGYCNVC